MNLSKPFIQRPVATILVMVLIVMFGIIAYKKLPVSSIPQLQFPTIQVSTNYPGASADQIADLISGPLERQFMIMQGVQFVSSQNTYQNSLIIISFHLDVDIDVAAQETEQAIQKALAELPKDIPQNPTYTKWNPSDTPVIFITAYSPTTSAADIYEFGYNFLGQQLGTVNGVANIQTYGYPYAIRVYVDPEALASRNVSLEEISNAIKNANPQQPTGKFYGPEFSYPTVALGQLTRAEDYPDIIVKYVDGSPLRLKDVARVENSLQNDQQTFKWATKEYPEGKSACVLPIYREAGYNTVEACDGVIALLDKLKPQLPKSILIDMPFNLSTWIREAVFDVEMTLVIAFFLVVLVIYFYLGKIKNSFIPLVTLPITITGTFILMAVFGYSLDVMSLSALTLSIGFLVDDAIVVLENIVRWAQTFHLNPYQASEKGSQQIILVVVAMSLSLVTIFFPMLFLGGPIGQIFQEFSAVIMMAVFFSGFISISLTPMLCSRLLAHYESEKESKMEKFSKKLNDYLLHIYEPLLQKALHHKIWVLFGSVAIVVLSVLLFISMPQGFLPEYDLGVTQCFIESVEGSSPQKMDEYFEQVRKVTMKNPYVDTMATISGTPTDNQGLFFYMLKDEKRPGIETIIDDLAKEYAQIPGIRVFQKAFPLINLQVGNITASKANYQYVLQSFNTKDLFDNAGKFVQALEQSPKLRHVGTDFQPTSPVVQMNLLRDQAFSYGGVTALAIENALKYGYGQTYVSKINVPQNMYYVILQVGNSFLQNPSDTGALYVGNTNTQGDSQVSLNSLIQKDVVSKPEMVNRLNALTSVTVSFDPAHGVPLSEAIEEVKEVAEKTLPKSVISSVLGNTAAFEQVIARFIILILVAVFVVYVILGILYENFLHPLTALSAIPVGLLGGLLTLLIFGEVLTIFALIGLIMLLGIVLKNGILIIDFTLEIMEEEKLPAHEAVYKACSLRFRPIVMTTIAAIMGAVPVALGIGGTVAKGRAPLGIAVVGGLAFAQIVTLFVTPVIFLYVQRLNEFLVAKFKIFQKDNPKDLS